MDTSAETIVAPPKPRVSRRKLIRWGIAIAILAVIVFLAFQYWRHSHLSIATDNAYVNANTVEVAAQVAGPITRLYVQNNQHVDAGQRLFDIDPQPFQLAYDRARAQLTLAQQSVAEVGAGVSAAQAQVLQRAAELKNAKDTDWRTQKLVARGFFSRAGGETANTQLAAAQAALQVAEANLQQARSALGAPGARNANVQAAEAAVKQAALDLQRSHVVAASSGTIANLDLRPGAMVQVNVPLFVIIGDRDYWVDANFKETELKKIQPGEPAEIEVDMYPHHPFSGVVESLSGGSGAAFSLLPPQNATGNWVKVTQRVPVRIRFLQTDSRYPLRVGTTAKVTVDIRAAPSR